MNRNQQNIPNRRFKTFETGPNWERRKVTELGKIFIGLVTTMTEHYKDKGVLLIRNSDIKDGRFEFGNNPIYLEESFAQANSNRMHQLGDVITVHTGDVGTSSVIRDKQINSLGFATIVTRPNTLLITSDYLCSYLNTPQHKKWAVGVSTGDGRTNYNLGDYYDCIVPVPSLREQHKISEFMSCLNSVLILQQHKLDKLKDLKKAYLTEMFPAEGERMPKRRFPGFEGEWSTKELREITSLITKGTTPLDKSGEGEVNFIKVENLDASNGKILSSSKISSEEHKGYLKRSQLNENDILFSIAGTLGRIGIVESRILPANTNQALAIIRNERSNLRYLAIALKSGSVTNFILRNPTIGAQPNLSLEQVGSLEIPFPSLDEQKQIGEFFHKLDQSITLQQQKLDKLNDLKKAYLNELFV